ncbi:SigE family RNA polymerase sigma factor [Dactylosporangium aurantiacum]|uniref:SigE family RNA polymerase sigma factor n=1 Tax=Dactylosporangium aurantiacum TaxID=35754 RepID=A0A9Q9IFU9_9ACTN|nr:SigE family RNA polymerase sigma factor [Dactylosporangium aurantiacum]
MTFEEYAFARTPALFRFARLLTGDDHRAEDLVQDVLARAYSRWGRIAGTERPDVYVRRMMVNAHRSWWRRRSSREVTVEAVAEPPGTADEAADIAERDALWRLVRALPARQRAVIVLRYYEDMDDARIAEILDCSTGTVRTHAKRALDTLRAAPAPRRRRRRPAGAALRRRRSGRRRRLRHLERRVRHRERRVPGPRTAPAGCGRCAGSRATACGRSSTCTPRTGTRRSRRRPG